MDVIMPQLGETVAEGTITIWHKKVGDTVAADELLFEVGTDKAEMEIPAPTAGVITEILVPEGETVEVGVTLAVIEALLGFSSEARFIRHAHTHLRPWFPYLPNRPGYNKRLRRSGELMQHVIAHLTRACPSWNDDLWLVDSTPVECGRSRQTQKRSDLAGWATYGYCASHSRFFWGLRLHLIVTPPGSPKYDYATTGASTWRA